MLGKAVSTLTLFGNSNGSDSIIAIEICPGCVQDIVDTVKAGPLSDREQAYKEPWSPPTVKVETAETAVNLARKLLQTVVDSDYTREIEGVTGDRTNTGGSNL